MLPDPPAVAAALRRLQRLIRDAVIRSRHSAADLHAVTRQSSADTIYQLDVFVEPVIEAFCEEWGRATPLVLIAEGIEPESGRTFPAGAAESEAAIRVLIDPVDGTRGLMYDKRAAWSLAGAAPNNGPGTRLSDIEVAVMTELPTSKMSHSDVLWATKGRGAQGVRETVAHGGLGAEGDDPDSSALTLAPSRAPTIAHGFASVSNFFPGTKVLASALMEHLAATLLGPADVKAAAVFDDQYISTGGQFYEMIVGHDRFIADLRPLFYAIQKQGEGLCCHPYDCATALIAQEAGVILTDGRGGPLDAPMDVTTGVSWAAFANPALRAQLEPLIRAFLAGHVPPRPAPHS